MKVLNLYACLGGRNLVDYDAGKTIFNTMRGIVEKSKINQTSIFDLL